MTGETRWVNVRTPQIGDLASRRDMSLDPRLVHATRRAEAGLEIQLDIYGSITLWLPADYYTFKRAELVPDLEPTDAEMRAFKRAWVAPDAGAIEPRYRAGLRAVLALRAERRARPEGRAVTASDANAALRMAARLIRTTALNLPKREVHYGQLDDHRDVPGLKRAANIIDAMIDPEEESK